MNSRLKQVLIDRVLIPAALPLGMVLVSAAAATYYVNQETSAVSYSAIAWAYPELQEGDRELIREAMSDGKLSHWEQGQIYRAILNDLGVIIACPANKPCRDINISDARKELQGEIDTL